MTNDIERHSPDEWRKTAAALMSESVAVGAGETTAKVNANGAPLLGDSRDLFRPKTSDIPAKPGVYKWRDGEGRVIYVGKAKNLRNRLTNYFQPLYLLHPRTQTMVLTARSLEWTVVATELESLTLEYTWIKEFNPRFNVQFRDDQDLSVSRGQHRGSEFRACGSRGRANGGIPGISAPMPKCGNCGTVLTGCCARSRYAPAPPTCSIRRN